MNAARQLTAEQAMRMKALSTARIQFAGASPAALANAAEHLFQYLRQGPSENLGNHPQEAFNQQLHTLIGEGYGPFDALRLLRGQTPFTRKEVTN